MHDHYAIVIEALREMAPHYIKWPSHYERHQSAAHFERTLGFAGAFASINGSIYLITKPEIETQRYVREKKYGVKVQVVSDYRLDSVGTQDHTSQNTKLDFITTAYSCFLGTSIFDSVKP